MAGTHFNKRPKLGILVTSLVCLQLSASLVLQCSVLQLVEGLFRLNMAESD